MADPDKAARSTDMAAPTEPQAVESAKLQRQPGASRSFVPLGKTTSSRL